MMYVKVIHVTKHRVRYSYVRICNRVKKGLSCRKQEIVVANLGRLDDVKESVNILISGLERIRALNLSVQRVSGKEIRYGQITNVRKG